ncbi:MAG: TetR/AcrR family transcriptional regulator [Brevinematia bacterium]
MPESVKERIMYSAIKLFAEKGFHETKVDEIAKNSDVSKGTIYLYFASKEELLEKSIDFVLTKAIQNYDFEEGKSFEENLRNIIFKNAEFVKKHVDFYKVMFSSFYRVRKNEEFMKRKCDFESIHSRISSLLEGGVREGVIRKDISISNLSLLLTNLIFSSMMSLVIMLVFGETDSDEKVRGFVEDVYKFAVSAVKG